MQIVAEDFIPVTRDDVFRSIQWRLSTKRTQSLSVTSYGKRPINMDLVRNELADVESVDASAETVKFLIATAKHTAYIADNAVELFLPLFNGTRISIKHSGIESFWDLNAIDDFISLRREVITRLIDKVAYPVENPMEYGYSAGGHYTVYKLRDQRYHDSFIGDPGNSLVLRAVWNERRKRLFEAFSNSSFEVTNRNNEYLLMLYNGMRSSSVRPRVVESVLASLRYLESESVNKITADQVRSSRRELQITQENRQRILDQASRDKASRKFASFWQSMKDTRPPQTELSASADFATIPLKQSGTATSRTWGIEIETVRANQTDRPAGWRSEYDGSLPDSAECSCDCDSCSDNDHCNDNDYECYEEGEANHSSREFVSPILNHFNSDGLRKLCNDLGTDIDEDHRPGIHVHVGAGDLTVFDITRLLVSYSAVERLLEPLLHRKERNYCKATSTDQLRWWLGRLRQFERTSPDQVPTPKDLLYMNSDATPQGRYVDVNIQALNEHGTIEFRSMGAWYDYNHLVRWAWLCREMVNVSKLGIDQAEWLACKSVADVINLLRKYGSEIPSSEPFTEVDTNSLALTSDEE